ncbi:hypothetical protein Tco_0957444 [Tanacetum coccineum]
MEPFLHRKEVQQNLRWGVWDKSSGSHKILQNFSIDQESGIAGREFKNIQRDLICGSSLWLGELNSHVAFFNLESFLESNQSIVKSNLLSSNWIHVRILQKSQENGQNWANTNTGTDRVHKSREVARKCQQSTVFKDPPYLFDYPTRRLTMEEILAKFIDEGRRGHKEMEIFIKEFRTTNELLLKERSNLLSELEIEVNELSKVMKNVLIPKKK